jgi:hypothetical protein
VESQQRTFDLALLKTKLLPETFFQLCDELGVCSECFGPLTISKDESCEVVCRSCGLVVGAYMEKQHTLPGHGEETNYSDTCQLAFGKSLGSQIGKYQLYSVLAKSANGEEDLGVRALHIKHVSRLEIPQIQALLSYGSELCKEHGLSGKDQKSIEFANQLGRVLRIVGSVTLAFSRDTIYSKKIARDCFVYLHRKLFDDGSDLQKELEVKEETLQWIEYVLNCFVMPRGLELFRKKNVAL